MEDQNLFQVAWAVRRFLEGEWPHWQAQKNYPIPGILSSGTCQTSSLFLRNVLFDRGIASQVEQGNVPDRDEGFFDGNKWHGHAWVLVGDMIVDITADQFGLKPVQLIPCSDAAYRAGDVDTASLSAKRNRKSLVENAWKRWIAVSTVGCDR